MRGYADSDRTQALTTFEVHGLKIPIYITTSGEFRASLDDRNYTAATLDVLKKKLRAVGRSKKVVTAILACKVNVDYGAMSIRDVVITGIHAKTGAVLYRDEATGHAFQEDDTRHGVATFIRRIPREQKEEYIAFYDVMVKARDKFNTRDRQLALDAGKAVKAEIDRVVREQEEAEEPTGDPRTDAPARKRR